MNLLEKLAFYWNYPFVRYALIVGVLIALCSSLLGVTLVLKRFSFIGDGLSHVAFGGMAVATVLGMSDHMPLTLAVTVACAVLLLHTGQNTQIKGDAAIAMVSVGALAMGYLLMNLFSTSANLSGDVCSTLFGSTSILTLTKSEVWLCIGLSIVAVLVFVLFYNQIFAVTFDETFAKAVGTNANGYNLLIAIVIAVIIVLAMNLVGSLLISALVIFPALSAMRLCKNFCAVTICSAVLSVSCAFVGIVASILAGTPVGSTIVAVDMAAFGLCCLAGKLLGEGIMKRFLKGLLLLGIAAALTACGAKSETASSVVTVLPESTSSNAVTAPAPEHSMQLPESSTADASDIHAGMDAEIDLTLLSDTVVNAEVYNMLVTPENYTDKIVRMTGEYQEYIDEQTGELYHSCVIYDALACCQQGVEFVLTDGDYPEEGTPITVVGRYETYTTPYYDYFHLVDGVRE